METFPTLRSVTVFSAFFAARAITTELYTTNSLCRKNACVNPLIPGVQDLGLLETVTWQCASHKLVNGYMSFCKDAVIYDSALPSPNVTTESLNKLVSSQDQAALTMFFYHLSGLGYEAWEHKDPSNDPDPCIRSVWKMACYTYFPASEHVCQLGDNTPYKRPCMDTCMNYLSSCKVECCDESAKCVFTHQRSGTTNVSMVETGYVDVMGPSSRCTGSGAYGLRANALLPLLIAVQALVVGALCLQGFDVQRHTVGNWRAVPNYLSTWKFVEPSSRRAALNSCMQNVPVTEQCSGNGYCQTWFSDTVLTPTAFCVCNPQWADPECSTRRKSQLIAFSLSLFGGLFGADYFYLGFPLWGLAKLGTIGGLGFWWLVDIMRNGAGPIYAHDFRVQHNLSHYAFVLITLTFFMLVGFGVSIGVHFYLKAQRRQNMLRFLLSEEKLQGVHDQLGQRMMGDRPAEYGGYGSTIQGLDAAQSAPEVNSAAGSVSRMTL